ncbi:hypothetical protein GCM10008179_28510 [Hansschlegelia plantiphila]|uniref:Uncharacterized protein n=1 Tax=Hansschlegelia plantiphila TaxID=374655 RepID=A0A9W6J3R6_9HYPH|nr:hypothetical protein GCM10008179_28510 [Hansschlegelia plantiphila]
MPKKTETKVRIRADGDVFGPNWRSRSPERAAVEAAEAAAARIATTMRKVREETRRSAGLC